MVSELGRGGTVVDVSADLMAKLQPLEFAANGIPFVLHPFMFDNCYPRKKVAEMVSMEEFAFSPPH